MKSIGSGAVMMCCRSTEYGSAPEGDGAVAGDVDAVEAHDDVVGADLLGDGGGGPDAAHEDPLARGDQAVRQAQPRALHALPLHPQHREPSEAPIAPARGRSVREQTWKWLAAAAIPDTILIHLSSRPRDYCRQCCSLKQAGVQVIQSWLKTVASFVGVLRLSVSQSMSGGIGWEAHSLVVCKEVVDDGRGYHIANTIRIAVAQGLKRNPHTLANLIEARATCTQSLSHEQLPLSACAVTISDRLFQLYFH